jgi:hypothetical protein
MNQSESIAKLSEALAKAQGVMEGASKDSSNPFFKSKYADLSSVWEACRKPLSDNGLSVVQTSEFIPEHSDMICIETMLCHSSGEWIRGRLAVKPVKSDPQSAGSCITYLRRYSLQSIVGIAPEDDDGNAASGKGKEESPKPREIKHKKEIDVSDFPPPEEAIIVEPSQSSNEIGGELPLEPLPHRESKLISEKQAKRLFAISRNSGWSTNEIKDYLMETYGISHSNEIPTGLYESIIEHIESNNRVKVA